MIIRFLGVGGGRFSTICQRGGTGGIYLEGSQKLHVDPGPGALVAMRDFGIDPTGTDGVLISHAHPDHYSDAEVLIEAMTRGGTVSKGVLIASDSVLLGYDQYEPVLSSYHRSLPLTAKAVRPGDRCAIGNTAVQATSADHSDPTTVGFKMDTEEGVISYVSDTAFIPQLAVEHDGARVLILAVMRPLGARIPYHLSTEDAAKIVASIQPELTIITHFGMRMWEEGPERQADWIVRESGARTIAAHYGMRVRLDDRIELM